jgi:hypothetical protein
MNKPSERYLEDFAVGQKFGSGRLRIDGQRAVAFAAEFDPQPFHLDEAAARRSIFGGLTASGWHTAAVTMRLLVGTELKPAGGLVGAGLDECRWPRPVRPLPGFQMPAIAVIGESFNEKRCFAFGYLLPVNSKKADAGTRQRLLFAKWRPSERKLKTGAPPWRPGGKLKVIGTSSIPLPVARITGPMSFILTSSACGRSSSACWLGMPSSRSCIILRYSAQRTCCS